MATNQQLNTVIDAAAALVAAIEYPYEAPSEEAEAVEAAKETLKAALLDYKRSPEPGRVNTR